MSLTSVNMPLVYPEQMAGIGITPSSPCVGTGYCLSSGICPSSTRSPFISYSRLWSCQMIIFFCGPGMLVMAPQKCSWCVWKLLLGKKKKTLLPPRALQSLTYSKSFKVREDSKFTSRLALRARMLLKNLNRRHDNDTGVTQPRPSQSISDCSDRSLRVCDAQI